MKNNLFLMFGLPALHFVYESAFQMLPTFSSNGSPNLTMPCKLFHSLNVRTSMRFLVKSGKPFVGFVRTKIAKEGLTSHNRAHAKHKVFGATTMSFHLYM